MHSQKNTPCSKLILLVLAIIFMVALAAPKLFAANQTWTNAPVDGLWTNVNNWVAKAYPGALDQFNNNVNNDVATFNTPIPLSNIGSASSPILIPDSTRVFTGTNRSLTIGGVTFDTTNCGAYVFSAVDPVVALPGQGVLYVSHNGSITINASVTNNQTFLVPILVRLPSSTAGIYNLVNNSTNGATLYIDSITNNSATTRGTVFVLGGTNTGTNTIRAVSAGTTTSGANGLTKQGSGTWILSGPNDFRSQTAVNIIGGTLIAEDPAAFSVATTATVTNGTLQINGVTLNQSYLNLQNGGNIRMNGSGTLNGVVLGAQSGNTAALSTTSASDVFTIGTGVGLNALVTGGAVDTVLNTAGPGSLLFNQPNTYIGKWSFNAATNEIAHPNALGTGANANVGAGAILDLTQLGPTTFVPTTSGFGGSGTGVAIGTTAAAVVAAPSTVIDLTSKNVNLTFTPTSAGGDLSHPALYIAQGSLTLSGNTFFINNGFGSPLGVGTYRLIQQASGGITSGGGYAVLVSGNGIASGTAATIQVSGGNVDLVIGVYVPQNLTWTGGSANANWDVATDANWWNGTTQVVFNNSDNVTFNSLGSTNPSVNLVGTLGPSSVTVDTSANDYTFAGSGQVAGTTALKKISTGTLNLQTVNTYAGGTVVSNGTLRVGVNNAISSTGVGDAAVYGTGTIDLNGFNNTINALIGNGIVDVQNGGSSTLTFGNNNDSGTFSGVLKNTSGTLNIAKLGTGTETLTTSNPYSGTTTVSTGTLKVTDANALGAGASAVTVNGTLDVATNLNVLTLAGAAGGSVANNSTGTTNTITILGPGATTFSGVIGDGSGGGAVALKLLSGTLTFGGANTYTGGTILAGGATLAINNGPAGMTGSVIASNAAAMTLAGGSSSPGTPTSITTVDGGTVTFTSGAEGKIWGGAFIGSATTTNLFNGPVSIGGSLSLSNFLGLVRINSTNNFRFFNGGGTSGGPVTTFEFVNGNVHTRDAQAVILGSITGGSTNAGIGGANPAILDTYIIGTKNVDNVFHGYISGSNNIVKAGTGKLVLDGANITTSTDNATYTNYFYAPLITYVNATTVSNGVLSLAVPNSLTNSTPITLAGATAVLDASQMGFISNEMDLTLTVTNQVLITNGVFELYSGQTLGGFGTIWGHLLADPGSIINAGLPTGTLTITNGVDLESVAVNLNLDRTNTQTSSQIAAAGATSILVNGGVLNVTNIGPDLVTGDVYQLFNKAITGSGFTAITLPSSNSLNTVQYLYQTNLTTDGTITVLQGVPPVATNPTNITLTVSGNTLNLSWPADHTGWTLQVQTNSLSSGLGTNWVDVPGSTAVDSTNIVMDPNNPSVFFRLKY